MKRLDTYYAYIANRNFQYVANALGFAGFNYDLEDDDFDAKLKNDYNLTNLLEKLENIESSIFLKYTYTKISFYNSHEYDILDYLRDYGYDDNNRHNLRSINDIICSRVIAYVTGVLSEYDY